MDPSIIAMLATGLVDSIFNYFRETRLRKGEKETQRASLMRAYETALTGLIEELNVPKGQEDDLHSLIERLFREPIIQAEFSKLVRGISPDTTLIEEVVKDLGYNLEDFPEFNLTHAIEIFTQKFTFSLTRDPQLIDFYGQPLNEQRIKALFSFDKFSEESLSFVKNLRENPLKIKSGKMDVLTSGTVITFENNPLLFQFGSEDDKFHIIIDFENDEGEARINSLAEDSSTVKFTFFNFKNVLGSGPLKPYKIGEIGNMAFYMQVRVYPHSTISRTVHYTFYLGSEDIS